MMWCLLHALRNALHKHNALHNALHKHTALHIALHNSLHVCSPGGFPPQHHSLHDWWCGSGVVVMAMAMAAVCVCGAGGGAVHLRTCAPMEVVPPWSTSSKPTAFASVW